MTRKHFEAIAAALKAEKPVTHDEDGFCGSCDFCDDSGARRTWRRSVLAVADVCGTFNHHFDRDRFLTACGMED